MTKITFDPGTPEPTAVEANFDAAIERAMQTFAGQPGQAMKAANLMLRWLESDRVSFAPVIASLIRSHIDAKIHEKEAAAK
jgi:hypothetical protein